MENAKIHLSINSQVQKVDLKIDYATQTATLNGKKFNLNIKPFVSELFAIVSSWQHEMIAPSADGIEYFVHIKKGNQTFNYNGRNRFPENFDEFLYLLYKENVCKPSF